MNKFKLVFSALLLIFLASCKNDPCEDIINGTDVDGECVCNAGFEGDLCDVEVRTKYLGTWLGTLTGCQVSTIIGPYDVPEFPVEIVITANPDDLMTVDVTFLMNETTSVITDDNFVLNEVSTSIETPLGDIEITYDGVGTLSSDTQMDLVLGINAGLGASSCPMTLIKQ